ncbi:serine hydrolase, partial [Streptosporangium sp. G11]|uniref:serine hydrolase n=1 Tax=Streptosporangium sp. G11 TaxID=3436926 RepID=UPI003EBD6FE5
MIWLDPAEQSAEMPSTNGICTARALARFYAALIGEVDGHRILAPGTLAAATAEQTSGIDRVLRVPVRIGTGFGLPTPDAFWYSPTAFGLPGYGGSLGFADPATGLAFGYQDAGQCSGLQAGGEGPRGKAPWGL